MILKGVFVEYRLSDDYVGIYIVNRIWGKGRISRSLVTMMYPTEFCRFYKIKRLGRDEEKVEAGEMCVCCICRPVYEVVDVCAS